MATMLRAIPTERQVAAACVQEALTNLADARRHVEREPDARLLALLDTRAHNLRQLALELGGTGLIEIDWEGAGEDAEQCGRQANDLDTGRQGGAPFLFQPG